MSPGEFPAWDWLDWCVVLTIGTTSLISVGLVLYAMFGFAYRVTKWGIDGCVKRRYSGAVK